MMNKLKGTRNSLACAASLTMVGTTALGVGGAVAGFDVVVRDSSDYHICHVEEITQDENGVIIHMNATDAEQCHLYLHPYELNENMSFVVSGELSPKSGCDFGHFSMDADGNVMVTASDTCFKDGDTDGIPDVRAALDYSCFIDDDNEAFVLNVTSYAADANCDPTLPASIVAGNVTVKGDTVPVTVEFNTQGGVHLLPPFSVASDNIFIARTGQVSGTAP